MARVERARTWEAISVFDRTGQRFGGAFQPVVEGLAVAADRRRNGDGANREGRKEGSGDECDDVSPKAS